MPPRRSVLRNAEVMAFWRKQWNTERKVHFESLLDGWVLCGTPSSLTTKVLDKTTCERCKSHTLFPTAATEVRSRFITPREGIGEN